MSVGMGARSTSCACHRAQMRSSWLTRSLGVPALRFPAAGKTELEAIVLSRSALVPILVT